MFTGLIADLGTIAGLSRNAENWSVAIRTALPTLDFELGESIAVDGACLTVTSFDRDRFTVDASPETLVRTTLGERKPGDRVHLERALRLGDRLGGHLVLGHVDGVGYVRARSRQGNAWLFDVEAPEDVATYLIDKGSVTVDGVSLTLNWVQGSRFGLAIIPFTSGKTKVVDYVPGQRVNLEADVLGKYVRKFVAPQSHGVDLDLLRKAGFM